MLEAKPVLWSKRSAAEVEIPQKATQWEQQTWRKKNAPLQAQLVAQNNENNRHSLNQRNYLMMVISRQKMLTLMQSLSQVKKSTRKVALKSILHRLKFKTTLESYGSKITRF